MRVTLGSLQNNWWNIKGSWKSSVRRWEKKSIWLPVMEDLQCLLIALGIKRSSQIYMMRPTLPLSFLLSLSSCMTQPPGVFSSSLNISGLWECCFLSLDILPPSVIVWLVPIHFKALSLRPLATAWVSYLDYTLDYALLIYASTLFLNIIFLYLVHRNCLHL